MNIFTRTFVIVSAACLLATILAPAVAGDGRGVDRPIELAEVLAASSQEQLNELAVVKMHALADLLGDIADEDAAREHARAAERYCLEIEMLQVRMRMLAPTDVRSHRYTQAKRTLDQQIQRIAAIPPVAQHLRSVTFPPHSEYAESNGTLIALDADGRTFNEPPRPRARLN